MIQKSEMKVYRSSSKIKKLKIKMLGGKSVDCKSGLSQEQMRLSIGICFLVVASLVQCIGATGTLNFILFYRVRSDLPLLFLHS